MRVLILGGTTQAMDLAHALADMAGISPLFSLAGRTSAPQAPPIRCRTGGFGGPQGLANFLREGGFGAVVDATHPFAAQMSRHAAQACASLAVPLCRLTRPPWQACVGDDWRMVADLAAAAAALGPQPRRVLLTTGRLGIAAFAHTPHFYVLRSIDPPDPAPPFAHINILARPPFTQESETALLLEQAIDIIVTKNSGAAATSAKLAAARTLRLPVVMVERPALPEVTSMGATTDVTQWLNGLRANIHHSPDDRGV